MERIMTFIDGSNFYYGLKSLNLDSYKPLGNFNFRKLGLELCHNRKLIEVKYYNAPLDSDADKSKYKTQQRFFEKIRNTPDVKLILVRMQKRKVNDKIVYVVKGDDIHIAVDMVTHAYNDAYDTAILVSGDGDFVPAVLAAQAKGKRVEQAYFKQGHSYHLRQKCNNSILLTTELLKKCFD